MFCGMFCSLRRSQTCCGDLGRLAHGFGLLRGVGGGLRRHLGSSIGSYLRVGLRRGGVLLSVQGGGFDRNSIQLGPPGLLGAAHLIIDSPGLGQRFHTGSRRVDGQRGRGRDRGLGDLINR